MTLHPRVPADVALAPVAAAIDLNLQRLRDREPGAIQAELQLQLDRPAFPDNREQRGAEVLSAAIRGVELHGWQCSITDDAARLHLEGGSVSLDLGLGESLMHYIVRGAT